MDTPLCGKLKSRPVDACALGLERCTVDPGAPEGKLIEEVYRPEETKTDKNVAATTS